MRGTALDHAVIIPFVCRLAREGPGGWEIPLVSDVIKTMEKLRTPPGTAEDGKGQRRDLPNLPLGPTGPGP